MSFKPMSLMPGDKVVNRAPITGDRGSTIPPNTELVVIATNGDDCVMTHSILPENKWPGAELFVEDARKLRLVEEVKNIEVVDLGDKYEAGSR